MYYTVCYFTGIFYAVVRQIYTLFIDNKDSVFCIVTSSVLENLFYFGSLAIRLVTKSKDRQYLQQYVGKSCLFWCWVFATICPLKNPPNFRHFDDVVLIYMYILNIFTPPPPFFFFFFTSASCLSSSLLPSSFIIIGLFSCTWRRKFLSKALVSLFPCVSSYRWIHFPRSVLSVLSTSPVVVHLFPRKRMFSFIFMKSHG